MSKGITFRTKVHFRAGRNGRKHLESGSTPMANVEPGRVPWVSKLMALAIRFDGLVRDGVVTDQAELARLGHVSRARVTQIMNLLHLAPDIQEEVLFLPRTGFSAWSAAGFAALVLVDVAAVVIYFVLAARLD